MSEAIHDSKDAKEKQLWMHLHCLELLGEYEYAIDEDKYLLKTNSFTSGTTCFFQHIRTHDTSSFLHELSCKIAT